MMVSGKMARGMDVGSFFVQMGPVMMVGGWTWGVFLGKREQL